MVTRMALKRKALAASLALLAVMAALTAASCGNGSSSRPETETSSKLPPAMAGSESGSAPATTTTATGEGASGSGNGLYSDTSSSPQSSSSTTGSASKTVTLSGVEFTVVAAKRQSNNKLVASSGQRQVEGDFLEVELSIRNASGSLVDLSRFSYRLWNPCIEASKYDDYYGNTTTFGGYVSANIISAALLDYSTLQKVAYTLRIGEEVDDVFLFFDLNPLSVSKNEGFTKEGSNLIVYDAETGSKAEVNLAGFGD